MKATKLQTLGLSLAVLTIISGCGSNSDTTTPVTTMTTNTGMTTTTSLVTTSATSRFIPMTMMQQIVMQDMQEGLEWVNGSTDASVSSGCHPMVGGKTQSDAQNEATQFCADLVFATHTDWRFPTDVEIQKYTTDMNSSGLVPFYANPACPRVVGNNMDTTLKTINTHNTPPVGQINNWANLNAGVRCVRAMQFVPMTMMNQTVLVDRDNGIEWVNGSTNSSISNGIGSITSQSSETEAKAYCENLTFATHTDWTLPNSKTAQTLINMMNMTGMNSSLVYSTTTTMRVAGLNDNNTTLETVNTHNSSSVGMINTWTTGVEADIRCVRKVTLTLP